MTDRVGGIVEDDGNIEILILYQEMYTTVLSIIAIQLFSGVADFFLSF